MINETFSLLVWCDVCGKNLGRIEQIADKQGNNHIGSVVRGVLKAHCDDGEHRQRKEATNESL